VITSFFKASGHKMETCDYIVVGSGVAGLRAALELSREGSVKMFCKGDPWESNSRWAQGGVAAAMQEGDTVQFHLQDTLGAGDGLCYEPAARVLVEEGPHRIMELVDWGAKFDRIGGKFVFGREGAHTRNRIIHAGDATGQEMIRALMKWVSKAKRIETISHHPAVDLLVHGGRCVGILAMDEKTCRTGPVFARAVLLATGGAGQIYSYTTNPSVATGDGAAIAWRAGADMMDMEFFQFHPTALHLADAPRFLLTEALRGEGAVLRNAEGTAFMKNYHPMADLAPRDVVSRAIVSEINRTHHPCVYLDATSIGRRKLNHRFPNIRHFLATYRLDLSAERIPVSPSAHYWMGGVKTGLHGETSLPGLFAAGEAACNGVHGANRLASNSLLEALVFGCRAGKAMLAMPTAQAVPETPPTASADTAGFPGDPNAAREQLQARNWARLGLIRNGDGIRELLEFLDTFPRFHPANLQELELLNLLDCSRLIGALALRREESRGSHYREDFPAKNPHWAGCHSILRKGKTEITNSLED
jgi:L-aspartate oxidase